MPQIPTSSQLGFEIDQRHEGRRGFWFKVPTGTVVYYETAAAPKAQRKDMALVAIIQHDVDKYWGALCQFRDNNWLQGDYQFSTNDYDALTFRFYTLESVIKRLENERERIMTLHKEWLETGLPHHVFNERRVTKHVATCPNCNNEGNFACAEQDGEDSVVLPVKRIDIQHLKLPSVEDFVAQPQRL